MASTQNSKHVAVQHIQEGSVDTGEYSTSFSFRKLWAYTGPGFLMSIAYLDPGNLESDLQAGAVTGYSLLWILFWSTVMGLVLQLLAVRLGTYTGDHLAEVCREQYPNVAAKVLWLLVEMAIIGSDIQEVIGSAIAIKILSNSYIPLWVGCLITALDTFTFLLLESYGIRKLEAFFGALISTMAVTFGVEFFISMPSLSKIGLGMVIPAIGSGSVEQAVGIVGAVIMPHNIYLHSALVQSRKIDNSSKETVKEANFYYSIESAIALFTSFVINLFVVTVFAKGFYGTPDADKLGLENAGNYLGDKYGKFALYVWAVGLLAAGQSSTCTGTYAGQFVMQGFLNLKIAAWKRVMLTRSIAIVPAVAVAILAHDFLGQLNEWLNVLQSIILPFALFPILEFTSSEKIMSLDFKNSWYLNILVWGLSFLILGINAYLIAVFIQHWIRGTVNYGIAAVFLLFYIFFTIYLAVGPTRWAVMRRRFLGQQDEQPLIN